MDCLVLGSAARRLPGQPPREPGLVAVRQAAGGAGSQAELAVCQPSTGGGARRRCASVNQARRVRILHQGELKGMVRRDVHRGETQLFESGRYTDGESWSRNWSKGLGQDGAHSWMSFDNQLRSGSLPTHARTWWGTRRRRRSMCALEAARQNSVCGSQACADVFSHQSAR